MKKPVFTNKHTYIIQAFVLVAVSYGLLIVYPGKFFLVFVLSLILVISTNMFMYSTDIDLLNLLIVSIPSACLFFGVYLTLQFFPNLSLSFKILGLLISAGAYYILALVNNIFLVVKKRGEVIPLYRVAQTWSNIMIVTVSIPLLSGIFKLPISTFFQGALAGVVTSLFIVYSLWAVSFDPDARKFKVGESATLVFLGFFIVFALDLAVSFIPTESFLRALYISSVLMFALTVVLGHVRNKISRGLLLENSLIVLLFLFLLFFFRG